MTEGARPIDGFRVPSQRWRQSAEPEAKGEDSENKALVHAV